MDRETVDRTMKALRANGYAVTHLDKREEVRAYLESVMKEGSSCAVGGSVSLDDCDVLSLLRCGSYEFYDRYEEGVDVEEVFRKSFSADYYLASANAITEKGELMFIDGRGNRVAAITYGPKKVFLIVSVNKICSNLKEAWLRCKTIACPKNAKRLNRDTFCAGNGRCINTEFYDDDLLNRGVRGCKNTICSYTAIMSRQMVKDRIEVILVDEECGY